MSEHSAGFTSTGDAKRALRLDRVNPNTNYAANRYWSACEQIKKLRTALYEVLCAKNPSPEEFGVTLDHEAGEANL